MRLLDSEEFLTWAGEREIGLDERYGEPRCLVYKPYRQINRFWPIPESVALGPSFIECLLDGLEPWTTCLLWYRGGRWPDQLKHEHTDTNESVRAAVLKGFGIASRFSGAIEWDRGERDQILTLAFFQTIFGWMAYDDLFLIPDHSQTFLHIDHHFAIHAEFKQKKLVRPFVRHMQGHGHHLPIESPDATFKRPRWMKKPD